MPGAARAARCCCCITPACCAGAYVQAAFKGAAERRCISCTLYVASANEAACALYRGAGFEVGGHPAAPYALAAYKPATQPPPIPPLAVQEDGVLEDYYRPGAHALKMRADFEEPAFAAWLGRPRGAG